MGNWTGVLNGAIRGLKGDVQGSCMGLILVLYYSAHLPDHFDAWFVYL